MERTASPRLWARPRPASKIFGVDYRTMIELAASGAVPAKMYVDSKGKKKYMISLAWLLSDTKGGKVA